MKAKKRSKKWTIILLSDARQSIIRFKLHKFIFLSFIVIFLTFATASYYFYKNNQTLQQTNHTLASKLTKQNNQVITLKSKVSDMETKASEVKTKLNKLNALENKVQQYITTMNGNIKNPSTTSSVQTNSTGGIDIPITMTSDEKKQFKVSNQVGDALNMSKIDQEMPDLVNRYQTAIKEMEKVNQKLKRVPTIWPTTARRITSPFGRRSDPFLSSEAFHTGVDIGAPWGSPVYAGADGTVILANWDGGYGNSILIRHSSIYKTRYGHMSRLLVKTGEFVHKGQLIGYSGSTGRSTGPHLHYEVIKYGKPVNPMPYMNFFKNHPVTLASK